MAIVPVARAEHLLAFVGLLREIGAPVDRELARARLPIFIEEMPEAWVSLELAFRFLMRCAAREGIEDLGFEAGWPVRLEDLSLELLDALDAAPTIKARLECFIRFARLEANTLRCTLIPEGNAVRVCIREELPSNVDERLSEWQIIKLLIEIVRSGAGRRWSPSEICLQSAREVHASVLDRLDGVNVHVGQPTTSFLIPATIFAAPVWRWNSSDTSAAISQRSFMDCPEVDFDGLVNTLRVTLTPYLASGYPPIELAAEILSTSTRSLQRRLREHQTSYSELIDHLRFDMAAGMLVDLDQKIIDIAMRLGYEHSPNFSRAFRRISGLTPRQYRKSLAAN